MISKSILDDLESLCTSCPKGAYLDTCPFQVLGGVSRPSRSTLFESMRIEEIHDLFDMVKGCRCPKDPRSASRNPPG